LTEKRRRIYRHGIFCLEGDWWENLKYTPSVEPVLRLLAESHTSRVPYIHRDIGTAADLKYYLSKWTQLRYAQYPILYLAFHGEEGILYLGDRRRKESSVSLDLLEEWLEKSCYGTVIYFGSCGTMGSNGHRLQRFLKKTGAQAVLGYNKAVDWIEATTIETLLLGEIQYNTLARSGLRAFRDRVHRLLRGSAFYRRLGFRMVIRRN
jgi:hypothetical protein